MKLNLSLKAVVLIIFGILTVQSSFSQENYLPGHIITLNGDTIQGFIDYRNWEKNPKHIGFKESMNREKMIHTATNINSFSVNKEIYVGAVVKTEISPYQANALEYDTKLKFSTDTCFLQTMIQGEKSLYFYKNKAGREYFYIKEASDFNLLVQKKYLKMDKLKGKRIVYENKKYIGQLSIYFKDCTSIQSKLKHTEYSKKSLENLFVDYYTSTNHSFNFEHKSEKITTQIGILLGVSSSTLDFGGTGVPYLVKTKYDKSTTPSVAFFFDFILPRNKGKFSIYNELMLSSYKVNGTYSDFESDNRYTIYNSEIGATYFKLNNMFRYKHPVGDAFIYANAGVSNGFALNETNKLKKKTILSTFENIDYKKALPKTKKHEIGFIAGLGIIYKKYSFEVRFENANGMSDFMTLSSTTKRFSFLLGYRF
ncbi:hypothetical protein ACXR6G_02040 [Ancylomarina sp. YFZ004]